MNNEFGYTYNKPFIDIDKNKQLHTIINIKDDCIELKINDVNTFNIFSSMDGKPINTNTVYLVDSNFNAITAFNTKIITNSYRVIPHTILYSSLYVKKISNNGIIHFTEKTKIKKINYFHEDLKNIFINSNIIIKQKFDIKDKYIKLEARKAEDKKIGTINIQDNKLKLYLVSSFSINGNIKNINVKSIAYIRMEFNKYVDFNYAYKIKRRLDSVIHLLTFSDNRCITMEFIDTQKNKYTYNDLSKVIKDKNFDLNLFGKDNVNAIFIKLLEFLVNIEEYDSNGFFPFLEFDRNNNSLEIQFLEYYRTLEFIDSNNKKKQGKGNNKLFLLPLIQKYKNLKNLYFNNENNEILEEEIRSLRNYYSHTGYYLDTLPIPTEKPKRYLSVDLKWKLNVRGFIIKLAYLELYNAAGIEVDEDKLLNAFRF